MWLRGRVSHSALTGTACAASTAGRVESVPPGTSAEPWPGTGCERSEQVVPDVPCGDALPRVKIGGGRLPTS
jgi:hypothetical protein